MNAVTFNHNGQAITFRKGDSVMVNATEMAKPFGKRPVDWLQNQSSKEFIASLAKVRKSTLADLVAVTKGGDNPGTWMHEDVAKAGIMKNSMTPFAIHGNCATFALSTSKRDVSRCREVAFCILMIHRELFSTTPGRETEMFPKPPFRLRQPVVWFFMS